jgi:hypothetical protein
MNFSSVRSDAFRTKTTLADQTEELRKDRNGWKNAEAGDARLAREGLNARSFRLGIF